MSRNRDQLTSTKPEPAHGMILFPKFKVIAKERLDRRRKDHYIDLLLADLAKQATAIRIQQLLTKLVSNLLSYRGWF